MRQSRIRNFSIFALLLLLLLTACSGQQPDALTWQEQYDLGVRYLSEGNYEEAIIAFTAAIEIDPKQTDAYIGLADAHVGMGDTAQALQVLEDAYAMLIDDRLKEKADTLAPPAQEAPAETETSTRFQEALSYVEFEELQPEHQTIFEDIVRLFWASDTEQLLTMIQKPEVLAITDRIYRNSDSVRVYFDGLMIELGGDYGEDGSVDGHVEIREETGTSIRCSFDRDDDSEAYHVTKGETSGWNWNGPYEHYWDSTYHEIPTASNTYWHTGTALNGLIHGELSITRLRKQANEEMKYTESYENGKFLVIGQQNELGSYPVGYDLTNGGYYYVPDSRLDGDVALPWAWTSEKNDHYLW